MPLSERTKAEMLRGALVAQKNRTAPAVIEEIVKWKKGGPPQCLYRGLPDIAVALEATGKHPFPEMMAEIKKARTHG